MGLTMECRPLISVVLPIFDANPGYLKSAVESVIAQTLEQWELVVVEDPSRSSAEGLMVSFRDPRIRYHRNAARKLLPASLNQGVELARADLVARFDGDDICEKERLERQVEYMRRHPQTAVLGSQISVIDDKGQLRAFRQFPQDQEGILKAFPQSNPLMHSTVVFRKAAVVEAGGYQYRCNEDYELWSRMAQRRTVFANHPHRLVKHRIHNDGMKLARIHDVLRTEFEIQRRYWWKQLDFSGRMQAYFRRALVLLPPEQLRKKFAAEQLEDRSAKKRR